MSTKDTAVTNVVFRFAVLVTALIAISVFERPKFATIMEPSWENGIVLETHCARRSTREEAVSRKRSSAQSPQTGKEISRHPSFKSVYVYCLKFSDGKLNDDAGGGLLGNWNHVTHRQKF